MNYNNVKKQYCCYSWNSYFNFPSSKKQTIKNKQMNKQKIQRTLWLND